MRLTGYKSPIMVRRDAVIKVDVVEKSILLTDCLPHHHTASVTEIISTKESRSGDILNGVLQQLRLSTDIRSVRVERLEMAQMRKSVGQARNPALAITAFSSAAPSLRATQDGRLRRPALIPRSSDKDP